MSLLFIIASISQVIVKLRCCIDSAFKVIGLLGTSLLRLVPLVHRGNPKRLLQHRNLYGHSWRVHIASMGIKSSLSARTLSSLSWGTGLLE